MYSLIILGCAAPNTITECQRDNGIDVSIHWKADAWYLIECPEHVVTLHLTVLAVVLS